MKARKAGWLDFASIMHLSVSSDWIRKDYIVYANFRACESLGYSQAEILGMSLFDIDPVMKSVKWPFIWKTLCEDGATTIESQHRRKDGSIFPVEVNATLIEFEGHRYSLAFIHDITERNHVYESLRTTQFIFDKAPLGIFLIKDGGDMSTSTSMPVDISDTRGKSSA